MTSRAHYRRRPITLIPEWALAGTCNAVWVQRDWFFPDQPGGQQKVAARAAKQVCAMCPVDKDTCRAYGDEIAPDYGVFGGMTAKERKDAREAEREEAA